MNVLKKLMFLVVALALAVPGLAQTTTTTTTITEAMTDTNGTSVVVASATGITASTVNAQRFILVDQELMQVRTVSGTTLTVIRGVGGTTATEHSDNANLVYGPAGTFSPATGAVRGVFLTGGFPRGACTAAESEYLPVFHVSGKQFDCLGSEWRLLAGDHWTTNSLIFEGTTNNGNETTLTFTDPTGDRTVTVPDQTGNFLLFANANTQDVSIIFEGATADANETTVTVTDPTADRTVTVPDGGGTVMLSSLATNATDAANAVTGASNALVFEGATADGFEISLAPADATADRTVTLPDGGGTVMLSSLATNATDAANAVTGASNALVFEGATADGFEISIAPEDAGADATISLPANTGNVLLVGGTVGSSEITLTNVDLDTVDNSVAANVCEDQAGVTAAGVATTDTLIWTQTTTDLSPNFSVGAIMPTGAGSVTIRICNQTAGALDPGAVADFRLFRIVTGQ